MKERPVKMRGCFGEVTQQTAEEADENFPTKYSGVQGVRNWGRKGYIRQQKSKVINSNSVTV